VGISLFASAMLILALKKTEQQAEGEVSMVSASPAVVPISDIE
jgi:hypothetical protein